MPMFVTALMNALAVLTAVLALLASATAALVVDTGAYISLPRTGEGLGTGRVGNAVTERALGNQTVLREASPSL